MQSIRRVMWSVILVCTVLCGGCEGDEGGGVVLDGGEFGQEYCVYNGEEYDAGASFNSEDGCNSCSCDASGMVLCTNMACLVGCSMDGTLYSDGDSFSAGDGCNSCTCSDGIAICTQMACQGGCAEESCGEMPADVGLCLNGVPAEVTCEEGEDGNCGWVVQDCFDACEDKVCGDFCDPCSPDDENCSKLAVEYVCGGDGLCTPGPANCDVTCEPEDCGVGGGTVELCSDGSPVPMTCEPNDAGGCGWVAGTCYDPCADASCGAPCVPCDLADPDCQPEEIAMGCDLAGDCVIWVGLEDACDEDLCADVICPSSADFCDGDFAMSGSYSECDPSSGECMEAPVAPPQDCASMGMVCENGACVDLEDLCFEILCEAGSKCVEGACVYDPCQGLSCGASCFLCDPLDPECGLVSEMPTFCDANSECVPLDDVEAECGAGLCADVECPSSPASCDGDLALSATFSWCDPATGECLPSAGAPPQDCASMGMTCEDGMCVPKTSETGLCEGTGGAWTECGSGCGPATCDNPEPGPICPSVCVPLCACPVNKPYWDENAGCVSKESCGGEACEPGEEYVDDDACNTCICPESGLKEGANCTKKYCGDECIPGASYVADDGCNTCICPESGLKEEAACTLMLCN